MSSTHTVCWRHHLRMVWFMAAVVCGSGGLARADQVQDAADRCLAALARAEAAPLTAQLEYRVERRRLAIDEGRLPSELRRAVQAAATKATRGRPEDLSFSAVLRFDSQRRMAYRHSRDGGPGSPGGLHSLCLADRYLTWGRPSDPGPNFRPHHEAVQVRALRWPPSTELEPALLPDAGRAYQDLLRTGQRVIRGCSQQGDTATLTLGPGPARAAAGPEATGELVIRTTAPARLERVRTLRQGLVSEETLYEYGAAGAGRLPTKVTQTSYWPTTDGQVMPTITTVTTVTKVSVNQPLSPDAFAARPPVGAHVMDYRFSPPLTYAQPERPLTDQELFYYAEHRRELSQRYGVRWSGPLPAPRPTTAPRRRLLALGLLSLAGLALLGSGYRALRRRRRARP